MATINWQNFPNSRRDTPRDRNACGNGLRCARMFAPFKRRASRPATQAFRQPYDEPFSNLVVQLPPALVSHLRAGQADTSRDLFGFQEKKIQKTVVCAFAVWRSNVRNNTAGARLVQY